ncbi:efflux RND transporter periplasmic adaptor subunit [Acuticoccus sp. I52.16.1]|uniref:efflux RND transporter periplasmic adaptor subunit n=1 Tax=Acuticoccus sp. I52.16.1 TaxID=2928472 RepID=UPI001FD11E62|nr:efflux RND transporter periplasmic adaptor subunit [Acuticoccus sp. I52.16.1]UOM34354.1 efflux RND transporter periplasmic adaptor subunit [Acuticoccus sp. I52.16.1]
MRAALAALAVAALTLAGCQEEHEAAPTPPRPVISEILSLAPLDTSSWVGTIAPRIETDLAFQVTGRVVERLVDVGDVVSRGEVVARLDIEELTAAERSAEASLAQAEAQFVSARDNAGRTRQLFEREVESQANVEDADQQVAVARSQVERARAQLAQARDRREDATLEASMNGVVTRAPVSAGATVSAGQAVLRLAGTEDLEAVIDLSEPALATIDDDAAFVVALEAARDVTTVGRLDSVEPVAEESTRTRRVHIALDDAPPAFRLGSLISARLKTEADAVLSLPTAALFERDGATMAWRVERPAGIVHAVPVELGATYGPRTQLAGGLAEGDEVITRGVHSLEDGASVGERIAQ